MSVTRPPSLIPSNDLGSIEAEHCCLCAEGLRPLKAAACPGSDAESSSTPLRTVPALASLMETPRPLRREGIRAARASFGTEVHFLSFKGRTFFYWYYRGMGNHIDIHSEMVHLDLQFFNRTSLDS